MCARGLRFMGAANGDQNQLRSSGPNLALSPARGAGAPQEVTLVSWLWLNISLMVLFAAAVVGIPLWLVLRRPDFGPEPASRPGEVPARVGVRYAPVGAGSAGVARPAAARTGSAGVARPAAARTGSAGVARSAAVRARISDGGWTLDMARPAR